MKRSVFFKRDLTFLVIVFLVCLCAWVIFRDPNVTSDNKKATHKSSRLTNPSLGTNLSVSQTVFQRLNDPKFLGKKANEAEKVRLSRWKAEFPWQPTHDPAVKFNPDRHFRGLGQKGVSIRASNTDMSTSGNHHILKRFFEDDIRYSPQFEQFYNILDKNKRGGNPSQAAGVFWALRGYYHAALEHEPKDIYIKNGVKQRKGLFSYVTWGNVAERKLENLLGYLRSWEWFKPEFATEPGKTKALALAHRLVSEIDNLGDLPTNVMEYGASAGMTRDDAYKLLNGEEELLVPYVGWNEQSELYWAEQQRQFRISFENGDPSLKAAAPELFPPVGVKNGRLVDKDGDPVAWREGMEVSLVNERGEVVPAIIEEDGSIGLPTPDEVDLMRANGELKPANFEELHPDLYHALGMGNSTTSDGLPNSNVP
jgi:hypothetical protein